MIILPDIYIFMFFIHYVFICNSAVTVFDTESQYIYVIKLRVYFSFIMTGLQEACNEVVERRLKCQDILNGSLNSR